MDECIEQKAKKYVERDSPPYPANKCKGKVLKGNDGMKWKSTSDSRGVYKWKKVFTQTKKVIKGKQYETHDNGGRPFTVYDTGKKLIVYKNIKEEDKYKIAKEIYTKSYKDIFIGDNIDSLSGYSKKGMFPGNSILANLSKNSYVFIGDKVFEFETEDDIIKFGSPVGNNDVPYPYAIGEKYTYFLTDNYYILNEYLDFTKDLYFQYYNSKTIQDKKKKINIKKIIQKRII